MGSYDNVIIAALAYNIKAKELFKDFANLNNINIDQDTKLIYEKIIIDNWQKEKKEYKGVYVSKDKFASRLKINDVLLCLGIYDTKIEAALAYNLKSIELKRKTHYLNNIEIEPDLYDKYKSNILKNWEEKNDNYIGVSKRSKSLKYRSRITIKRKVLDLGTYDTSIQAAIAYNIKAKELLNKEDVNNINIDADLYDEYVKEIYAKWKYSGI